MKSIALALTLITLGTFCPAQPSGQSPPVMFEKVEVLSIEGQRVRRAPARLRLEADTLVVEDRKSRAVLKRFRYSDIESAEYSYSKHPRWRAGAGTIVGAFFFPPLLPLALPFAIPLAFSKSSRHWLTVKTRDDYVVLRLDKDNRQAILPSFEVRAGIKVESVGEK